MKIINGHTYAYVYQGIENFIVDCVPYYSVEAAAKALGLTVEEFMEVW